jgi:hypothetical protein
VRLCEQFFCQAIFVYVFLALGVQIHGSTMKVS